MPTAPPDHGHQSVAPPARNHGVTAAHRLREVTAVEAVGLSKRYRGRMVVDDVGLTVPAGAVFGLIGPNGAGKTTLLRMIVGLVARSAGELRVHGAEVVAGFPPARTGALIESPGFVPQLSGRQNLRLLARLRSLSESVTARALAQVSLTGRADDRYRSYSLGMKQRLGVAAALLGSPRLLILDEPANGLDPAGVADMHRLIRELARHQVTVVVSSHSLRDLEELCDEVAVMAAGRVVEQGRTSRLVGPAAVRVRSSDPVAAAGVVERLAGAGSAARLSDQRGDYVRATLTPDRIPELVRALVDAGVEVTEVAATTRSLTDVYASLVAGGKGELR